MTDEHNHPASPQQDAPPPPAIPEDIHTTSPKFDYWVSLQHFFTEVGLYGTTPETRLKAHLHWGIVGIAACLLYNMLAYDLYPMLFYMRNLLIVPFFVASLPYLFAALGAGLLLMRQQAGYWMLWVFLTFSTLINLQLYILEVFGNYSVSPSIIGRIPAAPSYIYLLNFLFLVPTLVHFCVRDMYERFRIPKGLPTLLIFVAAVLYGIALIAVYDPA